MSLKNVIRAATDERAKQNNQPTSGTETPETINTESHKSIKPDDTITNLTIKVSRRQRLHWLISAKKDGITLTQAITDALKARYGDAPQKEAFDE